MKNFRDLSVWQNCYRFTLERHILLPCYLGRQTSLVATELEDHVQELKRMLTAESQ